MKLQIKRRRKDDTDLLIPLTLIGCVNLWIYQNEWGVCRRLNNKYGIWINFSRKKETKKTNNKQLMTVGESESVRVWVWESADSLYRFTSHKMCIICNVYTDTHKYIHIQTQKPHFIELVLLLMLLFYSRFYFLCIIYNFSHTQLIWIFKKYLFNILVKSHCNQFN